MISFSSDNITIKSNLIPPPSIINTEWKLIYYSKTKQLLQNPNVFVGFLWVIFEVISGNNSFTDSHGATASCISERDFKKAKKCLIKNGYITTKTTTINGKKSSVYTIGEQLQNIPFIESDDVITIKLPSSKLRKETNRTNKAAKSLTTFIRPVSKTKVQYDGIKYSYSETMDLRLSDNDQINTLLNTQCGAYILSQSKAKNRLRACLGIIDLVRNEHYSASNDTTCDDEVFDMLGDDENLSLVVVSDKYKHISQEKFQTYISNEKGSKYNGDGLVAAKNSLIDLGWLEVQQSRSQTKSLRNSGEKYSDGKFNGKSESKSYRLTDAFYNGKVDSRSSTQSIPFTKTIVTPFRSLAMCELSPELTMDYFNKVSTKRGWELATRSYQLSRLDNFNFYRNFFDKKEYPNIENSRVYTNICNLPKEFRDHILIDGESTVEIDMKSCHAICITQFVEDVDEINKWLEIVTKGDIYYHLIDTLIVTNEHEAKYSREEQRDQCKKVLNSYFNGASNQLEFDKKLKFENNFRDYMQNEFPNLDDTIQNQIKAYSSGGRRNGAALKLQSIESDLIGTYYMCNSKYDCISIHDGLLVKVSDAEVLIDEITTRATRILNQSDRVNPFPVTISRK